MLTAEDEYAVEYFANSFSLASSFLDNMSHQIAFGSIYEELIPLGLAKKKKKRGRSRRFELRPIRLQRRAQRSG